MPAPRRVHLPGLLAMLLVATLLAGVPVEGARASHGPTANVTDAYTGGPPRDDGDPCPCPEGHSGTTAFQFDIELSQPSLQAVEVEFTTVDDTATAPNDYQGTSGSVTFASLQTRQTVEVPVTGDTIVEPNERFLLVLTSVSDNAHLGDREGAAIITNDDPPSPDPTFSITDAQAAEDAGTMQFVVTLERPSGDTTDYTVEFATANGTATESTPPGSGSNDYEPRGHPADLNNTLTFSGSEISQTFEVEVNDDDDEEGDETFFVNLSNNSTGTVIGRGQATGTILDDELAQVDLLDGGVVEGDGGTVPLSLEVRLSHAVSSDVTVEFRTQTATGSDGASSSGSDRDYVPVASQQVTILAGQTSASATVTVLGDVRDEDDEILIGRLVELSEGQEVVTLGRTLAVGTIVDDDPKVSISDARVDEGDSGTRPMTFEISLAGPSREDVSVDFATADGSATAGEDYEATEGSVTIPAGETATTIQVPIIGDEADEGDETVIVELSNVSDDALIGRGQGTGTIVDDDAVTRRVDVTRRSGVDRIDTAVLAALAHWDTAPTVLLATARNYPDGLAVASLAAHRDAPLLLTERDVLPPRVASALASLDTSRVIILGGPAAVSTAVEDDLKADGFQVDRIGGVDRFETAALIAAETGSPDGTAVLALGIHADPRRAWPDALSGGAFAALDDAPPLLLTRHDTVPQVTLDALSTLDVDTVHVLGGTAAVSDTVVDQLEAAGYDVDRIAGADRYATSAAVADHVLARLPAGGTHVVFATGENFPDALAAGAVAGRVGGPVIVVHPRVVSPFTAALLSANTDRFDGADLLGGTAAVSEAVRVELQARMRE